MSNMNMKFPYMYTSVYDPLTGEVHLTEYENYESVEPLDITDREGMREVIREIDLRGFKPSQINKTLLETTQCEVKDALLTEDELITLIQKLRKDDSGTGKSNIEYICDYKVKDEIHYFDMNKSFREQLRDEKEEEENEYYSNKNEYDDYNSCYASSSNRFLNEIDKLK